MQFFPSIFPPSTHFLTCLLFRTISSSRCRFLCHRFSLATFNGKDITMSHEQQHHFKRYSSVRYFHHSSSNQSNRRTGMGASGSQSLIQNRTQTIGSQQGRQVYAYGYANLLFEEPEMDPIRLKEKKLRYRLSSLRKWEYTKFGKEFQKRQIKFPSHSLKFTVLSYNVLAQHLLEEHTYLYRKADPEALDWNRRAERILREVRDHQADILCLQEIQSDHYDTFYVPKLKLMGFKGVFKKRTGDKPDGCAIFFRYSKFELKESLSVEYCKPNVELLDRDNIGLITLLTPRILQSRNSVNEDLPFIVVATTHLLYNPRRHDIKLAQLQLLFAELDLIAFNSSTATSKNKNGLSYHPTILTGDFNLTPNSSIYEFITRGSLKYKGLSRRQLTPEDRGHLLDDELIPPHLNVTDQCQHLHATERRIPLTVVPSSQLTNGESSVKRFSTGQLSHQLQLQSVYPHRLNRLNGANEATTFQNEWITVDYIFHNGVEFKNSNLQLLSRLGLLAGQELDALGGLPSLASPSDHLPLVARFLWKYRGN